MCLLIKYHDKPLRPERFCLLNMMRALSGEGVDTPRLMDDSWTSNVPTLGKAPSCFYYVETIEEMRAFWRTSCWRRGALYAQDARYQRRRPDSCRCEARGLKLGQLLNAALDAVHRG